MDNPQKIAQHGEYDGWERETDNVKYELIIIGGGVWGCSAALTAVRAGLQSVLLIEANPGIAQESSAKAGGIVTDLVWHQDDVRWVRRSRQFYEEALALSGDSSILQRYGMLTLADPDRAALLRMRAQNLVEAGIQAEIWDYRHIQDTYPELDRLAPDVTGLWTPEDFHVNPTAYSQAVFQEARRQGLQARLGSRVKVLEPRSNEVIVHCAEERLTAERVLVTAGTWSRKLLNTAGIDIPLRPYRVQLSSLNFADGYHLPMVWDLASDVYLVPDGPHNLLAGDGTRLSEFNPDNYQTTGDDEFLANIADQTVQLMSLAETAGLRSSWAGLCGGTPDRRPLLGQVAEKVFVATGDQGFGVMRGPALGELACQVALGQAQAPQLNPLRQPYSEFPIRPGFTLEDEI